MQDIDVDQLQRKHPATREVVWIPAIKCVKICPSSGLCVGVCVCVCVGPLIATFWIIDETTAWDKASVEQGRSEASSLWREWAHVLPVVLPVNRPLRCNKKSDAFCTSTVWDGSINTAIMQTIDASVCFVIRWKLRATQRRNFKQNAGL